MNCRINYLYEKFPNNQDFAAHLEKIELEIWNTLKNENFPRFQYEGINYFTLSPKNTKENKHQLKVLQNLRDKWGSQELFLMKKLYPFDYSMVQLRMGAIVNKQFEIFNKTVKPVKEIVPVIYDENKFNEYQKIKQLESNQENKNINNQQKNVVYSAIFFNTNELTNKYNQVHPNLYSHHSTIEFKPQTIENLPVGENRNIRIIGRLTTDKVDVLIVDNPLSKNKFPHITLSTAEGVKPFESNSEIEKNQNKIKPLNDIIVGKVGYFDGKNEIVNNKKFDEDSNLNKIKSGVEELFDSNPELANIGTAEQYSQYLDTIFPDSKVKDILYHSRFNVGNIKNKSRWRNGFYSGTKDQADLMADMAESSNDLMTTSALLINMQNPKVTTYTDRKVEDYENTNDGFIIEATEKDALQLIGDRDGYNIENFKKEYVVFEPEQIHILGNKQDIEGFKKFVNQNQIEELKQSDPRWNKYSNEDIQRFIDSVFPNSKVKDVLKHTTKATIIDSFRKGFGRLGEGVYLAGSDYKLYDKAGENKYHVLVNINNLKRYDKGDFVIEANNKFPSENEYSNEPQKNLQNLDKSEGVDAYVSIAGTGTEYNVFEPEQIYILNSEKAIADMEKFVGGKPTFNKELVQNIQKLFESNPELANAVYEALGFEIPTTKLQGKKKDSQGNIITFDVIEELTSNERKDLPESILLKKLFDGKYIPKTKNGDILLGSQYRMGSFSPGSNLIEVKGANKDIVSKILNHELLHAVTYNIIKNYQAYVGERTIESIEKDVKYKKINLTEKQINALNELTKLKNKVITYYKNNSDNIQDKYPDLGKSDYFIRAQYSEADLDEFISEVFSNRNLIEVLKQIPSEGKKSNLFKDFVDAIAKILGFTNTSILEDIVAYSEEAFFAQPQITPQQKQQALQLYSQYLDTIFPDSKVKDIVYHGSGVNIISKEGWKTGKETGTGHRGILGYYFTKYTLDAKIYAQRAGSPKATPESLLQQGYIVPTIVNAQNKTTETEVYDRFAEIRRWDENYAGFDTVTYGQGLDENKEVVVKSKEQIHILGGKQDIEGFQNFVNQNQFQQKQQAQKLYSEYLQQNPNGNVKQFESWVLNSLNKKDNNFVQFLKGRLDGSKLSQEIEGKLEANKDRLIELLGNSMYSEKLKDVVYKELLQNSFDATKIAESKGLIDRGKIDIEIDEKERIITFKDNGIGMSSDIVQKAFFTIGGTYKGDNVDNKLKSGGLGLAKMAFIFGSEKLILETIHNGIKTTVDATSQEIRNDNFKIKTESTNELNGTKVSVKIPENYIDSKGENRMIDFPRFIDSELNYSFLKNPLIGNVDVNYSIVNRENIYREEEKIKTNLGNIPENYILFSSAKTNFADMDIYIDSKNITKGTFFDTKHNILSSGLFQFETQFKTPQDERIPLNIIIDIKPTVDATNNQYPFNNQRENFKPTIKEDIKALGSYISLLWKSIELETMKNSFGKIKNIEAVDVKNVDKAIIESNKNITKEFTSLSNSEIILKSVKKFNDENKEAIIKDGGLVTKKINLSKKDIDAESEKTYSSSFKANRDIVIDKSTNLGLDSNKPIIHNNTNMKIDEEATKFLTEISSIMIEYKKSIIDFYGEDYSDNISNQLWGVSIDKTYGGVNVNPSILNMLTINPFYNFPTNPKIDAVNYIAVAIDHLIIHELNHNFVRNEGADFTGRFLSTYSEVHSLPNHFELISKIKLSVKNNLELIKKLNYEYQQSENVESGFEGNKLEQNNQTRTNNGNEALFENDTRRDERTKNNDTGSGEKFGEILKSIVNNNINTNFTNNDEYEDNVSCFI